MILKEIQNNFRKNLHCGSGTEVEETPSPYLTSSGSARRSILRLRRNAQRNNNTTNKNPTAAPITIPMIAPTDNPAEKNINKQTNTEMNDRYLLG